MAKQRRQRIDYQQQTTTLSVAQYEKLYGAIADSRREENGSVTFKIAADGLPKIVTLWCAPLPMNSNGWRES